MEDSWLVHQPRQGCPLPPSICTEARFVGGRVGAMEVSAGSSFEDASNIFCMLMSHSLEERPHRHHLRLSLAVVTEEGSNTFCVLVPQCCSCAHGTFHQKRGLPIVTIFLDCPCQRLSLAICKLYMQSLLQY